MTGCVGRQPSQKVRSMKNIILATIGLALLSMPVSSMNSESCLAAWSRADGNSDGLLLELEAAQYGAMMRIAGKPVPGSGSISRSTFREQCAANLFDRMTFDQTGPYHDANSFTEFQALGLTRGRGLTRLSVMTKDHMGVWRGTGLKSGTPVKISVDHKGNTAFSRLEP